VVLPEKPDFTLSDGALFVIIFSRPDPNTQIAHRFFATAFGIGVGFLKFNVVSGVS